MHACEYRYGMVWYGMNPCVSSPLSATKSFFLLLQCRKAVIIHLLATTAHTNNSWPELSHGPKTALPAQRPSLIKQLWKFDVCNSVQVHLRKCAFVNYAIAHTKIPLQELRNSFQLRHGRLPSLQRTRIRTTRPPILRILSFFFTVGGFILWDMYSWWIIHFWV
jgi:hypothetical protein